MAGRFAFVTATIVLFVLPAIGQAEDDGGCVFDSRIYPEGYEMCQWGILKRCEEGAWSDLGMCDEGKEQDPVASGDDRVIDPRE